MLVRSRNGSSWTEPSLLTTLMRPTRSTTKIRPEPSFAEAALTGSLKPPATLTSAILGEPGNFPPGCATSAGVAG